MIEEITTVTLQQKATLGLVEELRTFLYMDHNVLYGRIQAQRRISSTSAATGATTVMNSNHTTKMYNKLFINFNSRSLYAN